MIENRNRNRHRWGIIYCPRLGAVRTMKRWKEISRYLAEKGVEFDSEHSEEPGEIERYAKAFADNGYETIVVVGGDGGLQDALNGIMASEQRAAVSLGIIPYGISNDFSHYWKMSDDYRLAVDCIMARRVRKVDLGCCSYESEGECRKRFFLNVLNIGLSAKIVELANRKKAFFAKIAYRVKGLFYLLFRRSNFRMKMRLNSQVVDKKLMMLCIGNSRGYGMTPSAVPYNGWLDVSAIRMSSFWGGIEGLSMLMRRKILNYGLVEPFRTTEVVIETVDGAAAAIDGRPFKPGFPMTVTVEPEAFNLIIPTKIYKDYDNKRFGFRR